MGIDNIFRGGYWGVGTQPMRQEKWLRVFRPLIFSILSRASFRNTRADNQIGMRCFRR